MAVEGKAVKNEKTKTYLVNSVINHDEKMYKVGGKIDLIDEQAEPLLKVGAIEDKNAPVANEQA
jgi:hypothetical protein